MVALVVTGLVVSLAYASIQAGFETSDRLALAQSGEEREIVARAILSRAIRHAVPGTLGGEPVFVLRDEAQGDELRFRTRGVGEPLGASEVWEVALSPAADGIRVSGHALDDPARTFSALLPRVRAIDVRVRGRDFRDGWFDSWSVPDRSPVAVSIAFLDAAGRLVGAPLVARVGLEGNP
jgi:hypothetical protein